MAGEAPQLSFIQGEISPEFFYRSDLASFNTSLSKASNIEIQHLGGFKNRLGSTANPDGVVLTAPQIHRDREYISCVFEHYVHKTVHRLQLLNRGGEVRVYLDGSRIDLFIWDAYSDSSGPSLTKGYKITGSIEGLTFIMHKDTLIFSKSLRVELLKSSEDLIFHQYGLPSEDSDYIYTETQFAVRMTAEGMRLESNFTLQNSCNITPAPTESAVTTRNSEKVSGCATYIFVAEDDRGNDGVITYLNQIPGVDMVTSGSTISNVIPYPIAGSISNVVNVGVAAGSEIGGYGPREINKVKVYRSTGKNASFGGLYKLVAKFGAINGGGFFSANDTGQEEAAYTPSSDTSMMYKTPSLMDISTSPGLSRVLGGLKSVVSTAVHQQRAYYAINKGMWWGTSVYDNTIVASRLNSPGQVIQPQITNPVEAFQFNVPEDRGGSLTHLVSVSGLIAFTDTSTFIIKGDDAGIITPTAINPEKLLSFGAVRSVPPATSGNTCIFAASCGGVGFVQVSDDGSARGGIASLLSSHMFEGRDIYHIVSKGDNKGFPRFAISTTDGQIFECAFIGDNISFTRTSMLGSLQLKNLLPFTQILSNKYRNSQYSPDYEVNTFTKGVGTAVIRVIPMQGDRYVRAKYADFSDHLDIRVRFGPRYYFNKEWKYHGSFLNTATNLVATTYLSEPTGTWGPTSEVFWNTPNAVTPYYAMGSSWKFKFTWIHDGEVQHAYATPNSLGGGVYSMYFDEDETVPLKLRSGEILQVGTTLGGEVAVDIDAELDAGKVLIEACFTELNMVSLNPDYLQPDQNYFNVNTHVSFRGMFSVSDLPENGVLPVAVESNGNIFGNFKDPYNTEEYGFTKVLIPVGPDFQTSVQIVLPERASDVSVGYPAVAEANTLPVASMQSDITDANKNIDYASVLMYKTKGLRIGEVGQPDDMLEKFDFTTDASVSTPVEFSGPKSYNFSSTWNDHGMVRISGLDLQPFVVSGIIPKGNVGSS